LSKLLGVVVALPLSLFNLFPSVLQSLLTLLDLHSYLRILLADLFQELAVTFKYLVEKRFFDDATAGWGWLLWQTH
jgi:hypothetical protein